MPSSSPAILIPACMSAARRPPRPVFGIAECGVLTALSRADRFGVIAIKAGSIRRHLRYLRQMGLMERLAGERPLEMSVAETALRRGYARADDRCGPRIARSRRRRGAGHGLRRHGTPPQGAGRRTWHPRDRSHASVGRHGDRRGAGRADGLKHGLVADRTRQARSRGAASPAWLPLQAAWSRRPRPAPQRKIDQG